MDCPVLLPRGAILCSGSAIRNILPTGGGGGLKAVEAVGMTTQLLLLESDRIVLFLRKYISGDLVANQ
jgi:hypothetical protein